MLQIPTIIYQLISPNHKPSMAINPSKTTKGTDSSTNQLGCDPPSRESPWQNINSNSPGVQVPASKYHAKQKKTSETS